MLLVSSVLMTPVTQPTPLKMTNKTYEYRVGLMSPISIHDPFPSARAFKTLLCGTSNKKMMMIPSGHNQTTRKVVSDDGSCRSTGWKENF